jgi:hypothetical protein
MAPLKRQAQKRRAEDVESEQSQKRVEPSGLVKEALRERTAYDLFCSILRYAKNQYHIQRDVLQAAAMQMLVPDMKKQKRK